MSQLLMTLCAIMMTCCLFTACSDDDNDDAPNTGIYAGEDFVGAWQGSDGSDKFYIVLYADGTYIDYDTTSGKKEYECKGTYSVTDNKITVPSDCNFAKCWGSGKPDDPIVMSFSGKDQMTWTTRLMEIYKKKLVLNRD